MSEIGHAYPARLHTECFVGLAGQARSEDPSKSSANSGHRSAASDINAGCCSSCPGLLGELLDGAWPDPSLGFSASAPLGGFVALCHCFTSFAEHSAWGCPGLLGETLDERNNDCDARASLAPTLGFSASSSLADGDTLRGIVLVQSDDEFASISGVLRGCPKASQDVASPPVE